MKDEKELVEEVKNRILIKFGHSDEGTPVFANLREEDMVISSIKLAIQKRRAECDYDVRLRLQELCAECVHKKKILDDLTKKIGNMTAFDFKIGKTKVLVVPVDAVFKVIKKAD